MRSWASVKVELMKSSSEDGLRGAMSVDQERGERDWKGESWDILEERTTVILERFKCQSVSNLIRSWLEAGSNFIEMVIVSFISSFKPWADDK